MRHELGEWLGRSIYTLLVLPVHLYLSVIMVGMWLVCKIMGCREGWSGDQVELFYTAQVGPCYASSKFYKNWNYVGDEPELTAQGKVLHDTTFAYRWDKKVHQYNMRGDESRY